MIYFSICLFTLKFELKHVAIKHGYEGIIYYLTSVVKRTEICFTQITNVEYICFMTVP
jgi:hypothetical protein